MRGPRHAARGFPPAPTLDRVAVTRAGSAGSEQGAGRPDAPDPRTRRCRAVPPPTAGRGAATPPGSRGRWPLPEQFACDDPEAAFLHLTSVTKVVWSLNLSGQSPKGREALRPLLTPRPVVGQEAGRTRTRTRGKGAGAGRQVGAPVTPVRRGRGLRGLRSRRKHPRGRASERAARGPRGEPQGPPPCRGGPRRAPLLSTSGGASARARPQEDSAASGPRGRRSA